MPSKFGNAIHRRRRLPRVLSVGFVLAILLPSPSFGALNLNIEILSDDFSFSENGEYFLSDDLTLSSDEIADSILGNFSGSLDGRKADGGRYLISGINKPLFHQLLPGASISNLSLSGVVNTATWIPTGLLANTTQLVIDGDDSTPDATLISNVHVAGEVTGTGSYIGGLVGLSDGGTIINSSSSATVSGNSHVGGLVGSIENGKILNSIFSGTVSGNSHVGGLVGYGDSTVISNVFLSDSSSVTGGYEVGGVAGFLDGESKITFAHANGNVTGSYSLGGLVGVNLGTVENSLATGSVVGQHSLGGLIGVNSGNIINSIAIGNVGDESATHRVGGLIGHGSSGNASNSFAAGNIFAESAGQVGGLIGYSENVTVLNSSASGEIRGGSSVGGLIGLSINDTITKSTSSGNVNGNTWLGGLIGTSDNSQIINSSATGDVGNTSATDKVGGLIGYAYGAHGSYTIVQNSYSSGNVIVSNARDVGGLIGYSDQSTISNSLSTGSVAGTFSVGGLIGYSRQDTITNSKTVGDVAGTQTVGGLIGDFASTDISNSISEGIVNRLGVSSVGFGTFIGSRSFGSIESSTSISGQSTFPYIANDSDWVSTEPTNINLVGLNGEVAQITTPPTQLVLLNNGISGSGTPWNINRYINGGKPYLVSLLGSKIYANETPSRFNQGANLFFLQLSPEEIAKRESSGRKILESLKNDMKKIEVEDFRSAGIVGVTDKSLPIIVELLAELEIQVFETSTVQKVVQIAGAISRIISVDQGKTISFIDLKRVGVTEIEYAELKDFSKFLALIPADKKNSIKEIQLLIAEFKKNKEVAIKAREAKKEATRIQREKNLQLILSMFKK